MTASNVLRAMAENGSLVEEVISYLEAGMWDEWDVDLWGGIKLGFGEAEFAIAARAGAGMYDHDQEVTSED